MLVGADEEPVGDVIEFRTFMRERPVSCRWSQGRLTGDAELLQRVSHMAVRDDWASEPATVARVISDAVAHPVTIRVVDDLGIDLTEAAPSADGEVLGDYWLG